MVAKDEIIFQNPIINSINKNPLRPHTTHNEQQGVFLIPVEIMLYILSFLNTQKELNQVSGVCTYLYILAKDKSLLASSDQLFPIKPVNYAKPPNTTVIVSSSKKIMSLMMLISKDTLAAACGNNIEIWKLKNKKFTPNGFNLVNICNLIGHEGGVTSIVFLPQYQLLASSSCDKSIRIWDLRKPTNEECVLAFTAAIDPIYQLASLVDKLISVSSCSIKIWDLQNSAEACVVTIIERDIVNIAVLPSKSKIATVSNKSQIKIWDLQNLTKPRCIAMFKDTAKILYPLSDETLVSGLYTGRIRIWNLQDLTQPTYVEFKDGHSTAINNFIVLHNRYLISVSNSNDHQIKIWDLTAPPTENCIQTLNHTGWIQSIVVSPRGAIITTGDQGYIYVDTFKKAKPSKNNNKNGFFNRNQSNEIKKPLTNDNKRECRIL